MNCLDVIDPRNDFCPGGAWALEDGDTIMSSINDMMSAHHLVMLTQDWHLAAHSSFASSHPGKTPLEMVEMPYGPQALLPDHCIQGSEVTAFHAGPDTSLASAIIRKGMNPEVDSYSAFFENDKVTQTGLAEYLREVGCTHLTMAGLATNFCVAWSTIDGAAQSFPLEARLASC